MGTSENWEDHAYNNDPAAHHVLSDSDKERVRLAQDKRDRKNDKRLKDSKL
jgi:hypothetical protein